MTTTNDITTNTFQVMPELTEEEFSALVADIRDRGIIVPVVQDDHGRIVDGHHRVKAATELGIPVPIETIVGKSDEELRNLAYGLNVHRRHLTREQKRDLIAREVTARPGDSDRAIGRRLGCDHKTVGAVRREAGGEIPHPKPTVTTMSREEAAARTTRIRHLLDGMFTDMILVSITALSSGVTVPELVGAITIGMRRACVDEITRAVQESTWGQLIDFLVLHGGEIAKTGNDVVDPATCRSLLARLTEAAATPGNTP